MTYKDVLELFEHGNDSARAVALALEYGQIDGDHHRLWVIDQMIRILCGDYYEKLIKLYNESGEYCDWDVGIAP